jgi:hypothetical protein
MRAKSGIYKIIGPGGKVWIGSSYDMQAEQQAIMEALKHGTLNEIFHEVPLENGTYSIHRWDRCEGTCKRLIRTEQVI